MSSSQLHSPMQLLPDTRSRLVNQVRRLCGIFLGPDKDYLIQHRVVPMARKARCQSLEEYCDRLDSPAGVAIRGALIEAVTTHETSFFRDGHPWDTIKNRILSPMLSRPGRQGKVRILSAACATGQEAWSLAIAATEACEGLGRQAADEVAILATDISERILASCRRGIYTATEIKRGVDPLRQSRFFTEAAGGWEVAPRLRGLVRWQRVNLLESLTGLGKFDLILCRNLLIYFEEDTRRTLIENLADRLDPYGYLMVGAAESLFGLTRSLTQVSMGSTLVYQLAQSG